MSKVVVILGFLVAFAAGVTVGWRVFPRASLPVATATTKGPTEPSSRPTNKRPDGPAGWLTEVLKLTPDQQAQMKAIWDDTAREGRDDRKQRREKLRDDRDEALAKLMAESGRQTEFDWIYEKYQQRVAELDAEWRGKFEAAVQKTKAILNPDQRSEYEEILTRHAPPPPPPAGSGARGGGPERFPERMPETRATSRPERKDPQPSRETPPLQGADR